MNYQAEWRWIVEDNEMEARPGNFPPRGSDIIEGGRRGCPVHDSDVLHRKTKKLITKE